MKETKKKENIDQAELDYQKSLDDFAKIMAEGFEVHRKGALEPFEAYSERIKSKLHGNLDQFRSRFSKGYRVLLEELSKEAKKDEGPGPHDLRP